MNRGAIFSLPNVVSMSRVVLAAGFVGARGAEERLALIGVASVTDFLDVWILPATSFVRPEYSELD